MAKLKGPLFSLAAHGRIGPRLTYSTRKSGAQVRIQNNQADVTTTNRTTQRDYFQEAYGKWNELNDAEKQQWNDFIK